MTTREETNESTIIPEDAQAFGIGIGRCGCGQGCGTVFIGMRDKNGCTVSAFQMHWSEVMRFVEDLTDQAREARREEGAAIGRAN